MNYKKAFLSLSIAISLAVSGCGNSTKNDKSQEIDQKTAVSLENKQTPTYQRRYLPVANPDSPSEVWDITVSVCGDVQDKKPGQDCFVIPTQKVWGNVGDTKLYYQTGLYKVAVYSSGCLSNFSKPQNSGYYSTGTAFFMKNHSSSEPSVKLEKQQLTKQQLSDYNHTNNQFPDANAKLSLMGVGECHIVVPLILNQKFQADRS